MTNCALDPSTCTFNVNLLAQFYSQTTTIFGSHLSKHYQSPVLENMVFKRSPTLPSITVNMLQSLWYTKNILMGDKGINQ